MASNIQPTGLDWKNLPQKTTPISAENLNKMANIIDDLVSAVNPLNTVEANPVGTPTEGLEKVEIDGTLYEVKGGHKILNDSGTTLTQKDNLQFKGVYTQNNGDNTEVDICRTMTKAQMEALSGESLKGFINTSDEPNGLPLTAEWVAYDSNTSVKDKIDEIDGKTASDIPYSSGVSVKDKIDQKASVGLFIQNKLTFTATGFVGESGKPLPPKQYGWFVRNTTNGGLYLMYFDDGAQAFIIPSLIAGSLPSIGDICYVEYFI